MAISPVFSSKKLVTGQYRRNVYLLKRAIFRQRWVVGDFQPTAENSQARPKLSGQAGMRQKNPAKFSPLRTQIFKILNILNFSKFYIYLRTKSPLRRPFWTHILWVVFSGAKILSNLRGKGNTLKNIVVSSF